MKVTLNTKVRVKLTSFGRMHLKRSQAEYLLVNNDTVETELWILAQTFASQMHSGNPKPPFVNMEIEVLP